MFLHFFRQISRILRFTIRSYDPIHEVPPAILRRIPILTTLPVPTPIKIGFGAVRCGAVLAIVSVKLTPLLLTVMSAFPSILISVFGYKKNSNYLDLVNHVMRGR